MNFQKYGDDPLMTIVWGFCWMPFQVLWDGVSGKNRDTAESDIWVGLELCFLLSAAVTISFFFLPWWLAPIVGVIAFIIAFYAISFAFAGYDACCDRFGWRTPRHSPPR